MNQVRTDGRSNISPEMRSDVLQRSGTDAGAQTPSDPMDGENKESDFLSAWLQHDTI